MARNRASLSDLLIAQDPYIAPYRDVIQRRHSQVKAMKRRLTGGRENLPDWAAGHTFFGLHRKNDGWTIREWAPNATAIYLIGTFSGWHERPEYAFKPEKNGVWELHVPFEWLQHGDLYRLRVHWPGGAGDRIPAYARWVAQDPDTLIFNARVWAPEIPFCWRHSDFIVPPGPKFIYEAHVGMAQDAERIGSYEEFVETVIPIIRRAGYDTLQLMAIQEHPYYGSFGYHVSNFFAPSSRFGNPDNFKALVDAAHGAGIAVIMDLVHSHSVKNEVEGLSRFDGTFYQYFHEGPRGEHVAWDSRCFDYGKPEVLHFLLSNCRYWLDEFKVDGFRFDGVTSMLFYHHGLGKSFTSYDDYFGDEVDEAALTYLTLASEVIHSVRPDAINIAEDVSGMPGLAVPADKGGVGFDFRFAMGVPDEWIRLTQDVRDEDWPIGHLWYELTNRRKSERTISYAESHDQALVGDKTLMTRLVGEALYHHMRIEDESLAVDRGMALHKMIRLITLSTADAGYLNFMGNEFGHPEWIDFPRQGNGWSYKFARRQWHLADDPGLRYGQLGRFDRDMIAFIRHHGILSAGNPSLCIEHQEEKILAFSRGSYIFCFNFHSARSYTGHSIPVPEGDYRLVLNTDTPLYGGFGRIKEDQRYTALPDPYFGGTIMVRLYLPSRTALVLEKLAEA
jgi:1,4-alpha-glucan branching enzyme